MPHTQGVPVRPAFTFRPSKLAIMCSAGFLATLPMVALAHFARGLHLPGPEFGLLYGTLFGSEVPGAVPAAFSSWWWLGYGVHFFATVLLLPLLFEASRMVQMGTDIPLPARGALFGTVVGLLFEGVIRPLAGQGVFSALVDYGAVSFLLTMACWVLYGVLLSLLDRDRLLQRRSLVPQPH
jgi:hypothetical protein